MFIFKIWKVGFSKTITWFRSIPPCHWFWLLIILHWQFSFQYKFCTPCSKNQLHSFFQEIMKFFQLCTLYQPWCPVRVFFLPVSNSASNIAYGALYYCCVDMLICFEKHLKFSVELVSGTFQCCCLLLTTTAPMDVVISVPRLASIFLIADVDAHSPYHTSSHILTLEWCHYPHYPLHCLVD